MSKVTSAIKAIDHRWFIIWGLVYATFLVLDIFWPTYQGVSVLKYAGIFLCLAYAHHRSNHDTLLTLALFMTFLADTILIWTTQFVFGIFVFCFAHFFHIIRFTKTSPRFLIFYYLIIVSVFLFILLQDVPPIYAIAFVYAISLTTNVILSIRLKYHHRKSPAALFACIGFILFLLCDICVGFQFLSGEGVFPQAIYAPATYLVWLFYYPSQIFISNSSIEPLLPSKTPTKSDTILS